VHNANRKLVSDPLNSRFMSRSHVLSVASAFIVCTLNGTCFLQSTRIKRLKQAAADFLLRAVPSGYSVGIVTFNKTAKIRKRLTTISTSSDREDLIRALPEYGVGNTAIGSGLKTGVEVLV